MNTANDIRTDILNLMRLLGRKLEDDETHLKEDLVRVRFNLATKVFKKATVCAPPSDRPCTEQDVIQSIESFTGFHTEISASRPVVREQNAIKAKLENHVAVLQTMVRVLATQVNRTVRADIKRRLDKFETALSRFGIGMYQLGEAVFQTGLQKMFSHTDDLWPRFYKFGEHVTPRKILKPSVVISGKATRLVPSTSSQFSDLPPEIMVMVLKFCDLETCVKLREVSSSWYTVFANVDGILEQKVQARNPWIRPEDDLSSWQDCALVFVARLRTWKSEAVVDSISVADKEETRKTVVAFELGRNEQLPSGFSFMTAPHHCGCSCQHMHIIDATEQRDFKRDALTLEVTEYDSSQRVVSSNDQATVVQVPGGLKVTLPSPIQPQDFEDDYTVVNTLSHVIVTLKDHHSYILPRDQPHYEHGFQLRAGSRRIHEVGGVLVGTRENRHDGEMVYDFLDFTKQHFRGLMFTKGSHLVASYNGLMWWKKNRVLIPTFIDLQSRRKVYYSETKAITGVSRVLSTQCSQSRDAAQFCMSSSECGSQREIVDLSTGIITAVQTPIDWPEVNDDLVFFVGWQNGQFQARVMHPKGVTDVKEETFRRYGVPEDDW